MKSSTLNMHYTIASPTDFGIYNYQAKLPIYKPNEELTDQAALENILSSLQNIDSTKLSASNAYTYTLLERSLTNSLHLNQYKYYSEPLSPSSGMQSQLPILLAEYSFRDKRDIEDYLALLDQTDEYFASLLLYEQEKAAAGLLMPASSLEKIQKQCDTIVTLEELEKNTHFLQTTFAERLQNLITSQKITAEEAQNYNAHNDRLLKTVLCPAYEALSDGLFLLQDSTIPLSGLAAKPLGKEYYEYLLISETGSYRPVSDVEKLLTTQLEQEYQSMRTLLQETPTLMEQLKEEQYNNLPYLDAATMLTDLQQRMQSDFPSLTKTGQAQPTVMVKNVSKNLEQYTAPAFYLTPPIDDTDNNVIYINQKNSPKGLELYTTLAHEGYPGHLYQTVYSNRSFLENKENKVRQLLWYGGYLEGWALYVEFLSYDYASRLLTEQNRPMDALCVQIEKHNRSLQLCLYSIIDIMIHYENASYSQVAKLLENFGVNNPNSVAAIYTYIAEEPCNYLKYYLGYLEILELQKAAKAQWSDSYTDYAFHSFYLDCGPSDFTSLTERLEATSQQYERID
ncbi:MAG: DUF885 domain-containing protein [Lachnospiraceae bacterium]|nr:DUF885 domain-containing protein [Lachnospiraceae bacterium]